MRGTSKPPRLVVRASCYWEFPSFLVFSDNVFCLSIFCLASRVDGVAESLRYCRSLLATYPRLWSITVSWVVNFTQVSRLSLALVTPECGMESFISVLAITSQTSLQEDRAWQFIKNIPHSIPIFLLYSQIVLHSVMWREWLIFISCLSEDTPQWATLKVVVITISIMWNSMPRCRQFSASLWLHLSQHCPLSISHSISECINLLVSHLPNFSTN